MQTYKAGQVVTTDKPFTTPIGVHFPAGSRFVVDMVGSVSTRCRGERCGSVVWISDGWFLTDGTKR